MPCSQVKNIGDVIARVLPSDDPADETAPRDLNLPSEALLPEIAPGASI